MSKKTVKGFKNVYVIVEVTFDYHRYQRNFAAFFTKRECKSFLELLGNKLPVLEYDEKKAKKKESEKVNGQSHIWIQKLKAPKYEKS